MRHAGFLFFLALGLFLLNCNGSKKSAINSEKVFLLSVGKTGGFTNTNPLYTLNNKGELNKKEDSESDFKFIKKIPASKTDSVMLLVKQSKFLEQKIDYTSNITYFIELQQGTLNNKISWGDDSQITPELKRLHLFLLSLIQK